MKKRKYWEMCNKAVIFGVTAKKINVMYINDLWKCVNAISISSAASGWRRAASEQLASIQWESEITRIICQLRVSEAILAAVCISAQLTSPEAEGPLASLKAEMKKYVCLMTQPEK